MNRVNSISLLAILGMILMMPPVYGFDPALIDISVYDASITEYPDYDIITIIFSIFNGDSQTAEFTGHNMLYLNDTNADWWEYSNHNDHTGLSETDCPSLNTSVPSGNATNVTLCYLTIHDPEVGYSVIVNNDSNLKDMETNEVVLESVPDWFKTTAGAWCSDSISDTDYLNSLEFNIQQGNIDVLRGQSTTDANDPIPQWVKTNACDWSNNQITEYEFLDGTYWLIDNGKIQLN